MLMRASGGRARPMLSEVPLPLSISCRYSSDRLRAPRRYIYFCMPARSGFDEADAMITRARHRRLTRWRVTRCEYMLHDELVAAILLPPRTGRSIFITIYAARHAMRARLFISRVEA